MSVFHSRQIYTFAFYRFLCLEVVMAPKLLVHRAGDYDCARNHNECAWLKSFYTANIA